MKRNVSRRMTIFAVAACPLVLVVCFPVLFSAVASAQQIQLGDNDAAPLKKQHVLLLSDAITLSAGMPQTVELRFRVDPGFHINSHNPKDELLIATVLKLDESGGIKVVGEDYPAGAAFKLGVGNTAETLDVYQNEFSVRLRLSVPKGATSLTGTLRYQACDNAACFPPRSLPVRVAVQTK